MIRVRFAPSPTGFLHIGGLRTALYNFLFARKNNGVFILRVEDTDQTRTVPGGIENIIDTLNKAGLTYDEGPYLENPRSEVPISSRISRCNRGSSTRSGLDKVGTRNPKQIQNSKLKIKNLIIEKGEYGSYIQSKRLEIYQKYAEELIKNGNAYYCFCTGERLESLRQEQIAGKKPPMYDGQCRTLPNDEISKKLKSGEQRVIRLNVPDAGETEVIDVIHGKINFQNALIDDQVLLKSDGFPTYHLANVLDDHLMKITHIVRGEEWLPSTPKHLLLYKAFGWTPPEFAHLPLLLNSDRSKLSKRQGDVAVEDYLGKGYLPEALLNFIALLGWNPSNEQEIYTLEELVGSFDLARVNKSGAIFNLEKLNWLNGCYLRKKSPEELTDLAVPHLTRAGLIKAVGGEHQIVETGEGIERGKLEAIVRLEQERITKLEDIVYGTEFFWRDALLYDSKILIWKKSTRIKTIENLVRLREFFKKLKNGDFAAPILEEKIKAWIRENQLDNGSVLWPMRVALSGREASPPPFDIAAIIGKDKTLKRLAAAIELISN